MDVNKFLADLNSIIGGHVIREEYLPGNVPRILGEYKGYSVKIDFISASEFLIDINLKPPHVLRIQKEGFFSRLLEGVGISSDVKVGDTQFDDKYQIKYATEENAKAFLSPEVRSLLAKLEPFGLFELTHKEYRCLKFLNEITEYTVDDAIADLGIMIDIIESSK